MNSNLTTPYPTPNTDTSWEELRKLVQQQAELIRTLQAEQVCRCHIIDPSKMRILLWINRSKQGKPETCVLKIAEQRLLGLPRSDRRGEVYWRFDEILEKSPEPKEEAPTNFKCSQCQEEVAIIGAENPAQEIKQREKLKQELAQMEVKEEPNPKKEARQVLKEQIAQATAENQAKAENKVSSQQNQATKNLQKNQNEPTPS